MHSEHYHRQFKSTKPHYLVRQNLLPVDWPEKKLCLRIRQYILQYDQKIVRASKNNITTHGKGKQNKLLHKTYTINYIIRYYWGFSIFNVSTAARNPDKMQEKMYPTASDTMN